MVGRTTDELKTLINQEKVDVTNLGERDRVSPDYGRVVGQNVLVTVTRIP